MKFTKRRASGSQILVLLDVKTVWCCVCINMHVYLNRVFELNMWWKYKLRWFIKHLMDTRWILCDQRKHDNCCFSWGHLLNQPPRSIFPRFLRKKLLQTTVTEFLISGSCKKSICVQELWWPRKASCVLSLSWNSCNDYYQSCSHWSMDRRVYMAYW